MKVSITYLLIMAICVSCREEKAITIPEFNKAEFPVTVGSYWKYKVRDFIINAEYNAIHKIDWAEVVNADTQILHYTLYNENMTVRDSAIGILTNTGFTYVGVKQAELSLFGNFHLKFPLSPGLKWVSVMPGDTLEVMWHSSKFSIRGKVFDEVFYISNYYKAGLDRSRNDVLVVKGIGIMDKGYSLENGNDVYDRKQYYSLIDYHIE